MFETLEDIQEDIKRRLIRAGKDRRAAMHTPVVGTADADVRVMVLREFVSAEWTLRFHTDARSPKCAAIAENAAVGVLLYDPAAKIQIRVRGQGQVLRAGPEVEAAWSASNEYARRCYLAVDAPGAAVDGPTSGLPEAVEGIRPDEASLLPARENFALMLVKVEALDWLHLAHDGHRRARFEVQSGEGHWAVP